MDFFIVMLNHLFLSKCVYLYVSLSVCHFLRSPESKRLYGVRREEEGGGGSVSRGSCLIDVFWG